MAISGLGDVDDWVDVRHGNLGRMSDDLVGRIVSQRVKGFCPILERPSGGVPNSTKLITQTTTRTDLLGIIHHKNEKMPRTYAVLGATGNCGTALIQVLLKEPNAHIRAFVRNKGKLIRLIPELADNKNVEIIEGSIHDGETITAAIHEAQVVFLCVSTNDNVPGCRMGQDTATSVIRALEGLKNGEETKQNFRAPKLVQLSSNTLDDQLSQHTPWLIRQILLRSASHVYKDLELAETFLRAQQDWLQTVFIKPGGLSVDVQRGHALSLVEEKSPLSYLDLAAGMIEAADEPEGKWDMQNVGVCHTAGPAQWPRGALLCISMGFIRHYLPFLHPYLPNTGPY